MPEERPTEPLGGPPRTPRSAIWTLTLGIVSFVGSLTIFIYILHQGAFMIFHGQMPYLIFLSYVILPAITAVIGIYALIVSNKSPGKEGRFITTFGLFLVAIQMGGEMIFIALMPFSCCCCCCVSGSESSKGFIPILLLPAFPLRRGLTINVPANLDALTAHHPNEDVFRNDVYVIKKRRFCIGCFTTYPIFIISILPLYAFGIITSWANIILLGFILASFQLFSSLGWVRTRWTKIAVKAFLGLGLAAIVAGTMAGPWPLWGKGMFLFGVLLVAYASAIPRALRLCHRGSDASQ